MTQKSDTEMVDEFMDLCAKLHKVAKAKKDKETRVAAGKLLEALVGEFYSFRVTLYPPGLPDD